MSVPDQRGFSIAELLVVVAIIAITALIATPLWLTYLGSATVTGAAREIQSGLFQARQLALSTRQNICVQVVPGGVQFRQGGCAGAVWTGVGNGSGTLRPSSDVGLVGGSPIFTPFGNASQTAILTVIAPSGTTQTVTVLPSGRVTIP